MSFGTVGRQKGCPKEFFLVHNHVFGTVGRLNECPIELFLLEYAHALPESEEKKLTYTHAGLPKSCRDACVCVRIFFFFALIRVHDKRFKAVCSPLPWFLVRSEVRPMAAIDTTTPVKGMTDGALCRSFNATNTVIESGAESGESLRTLQARADELFGEEGGWRKSVASPRPTYLIDPSVFCSCLKWRASGRVTDRAPASSLNREVKLRCLHPL